MKLNSQTLSRGVAAASAAALVLGTHLNASAAFVVPPEIAESQVSVGLVGAGVFGIAVAVKLYKWIKGAL